MGELRFFWDPRKAQANLRKHGISFEEAETVFLDEHALLIDDPDPTRNERFLLLGLCDPSSGRVPLREGQRRYHADHQRASGGQARTGAVLGEAEAMRKQHDFSKARKNPYAKRLKKQITIRLDLATIQYFKAATESTGIPYQTLINLYLRDCAAQRRRLSMEWKASA